MVDGDALPIPEEVRRWHDAHGGDAVAAALSGGDDYELLFTVRPKHAGRLRGAANALRRPADNPDRRRHGGYGPAGSTRLSRDRAAGGIQHFR